MSEWDEKTHRKGPIIHFVTGVAECTRNYVYFIAVLLLNSL